MWTSQYIILDNLSITMGAGGGGGEGGGVVRVHLSFRAKLYIFFFYKSRPTGKVRMTSSDQVRFFYRGRFIIGLSNAI